MVTGFVFLDKEEGMTSFTASRRVGKIFSVKKAGHTGTLDPMATGVMVVALSGATRFIELIDNHDKSYKATFVLGKTTDTLDITGKVLIETKVTATKKDVLNVLQNFKGEISQLPPMYSAVKKDGVRLYDLARQGIEIEREERRVTIYSLELLNADEEKNEYEIEVSCSKGTYIRSLISDIGQALSCGATMTKLRRTVSNGVPIEKCYTLKELEDAVSSGKALEVINDVDSFISYEKITVSSAQARRFSNGGELDVKRLHGKKEPGLYNVYSPEGAFLGIGEIDSEKAELSVKRVYVPSQEKKGTAVALGFFDGIHKGHRAVVEKALEKAKDKKLVPVVTLFDIHPKKALSDDIPPILMSDSLKRDAFEKMGFEIYNFDFLKAMNYTPEQFAEKILVGELNAKAVACGYDFRYGKDGKGTAKTLEDTLRKKGIEVCCLEAVASEGEAVSSTKIRKLISEGEIEKANEMLGSFFTYDFIVEKGDGLGKKLGFPTANQLFPENFSVPKYGVYASLAKIEDKLYSAVTNIGVRPTVSGKELRSETNILDFDGKLYGEKIRISLIEYLREEKKFSSVEELKEAISKDIIKSRKVFKRVVKDE